MTRRFVLALAIVLTSGAASAESIASWLRLGETTKEEVDRRLGAPATALSATLHEYPAIGHADGRRVRRYVQYRQAGALVAERIEWVVDDGQGIPPALLQQNGIALPELAGKMAVVKGRFVKYYGAPDFIVATLCETNDSPCRLALYSPGFFASVVAKLDAGQPIDDAGVASEPSAAGAAADVPLGRGESH